MALHGAKGVFSFAKENTPFISPRERLTLRDWHLKSCTRCAIGCGVHGFAMSPCVSMHLSTARTP